MVSNLLSNDVQPYGRKPVSGANIVPSRQKHFAECWSSRQEITQLLNPNNKYIMSWRCREVMERLYEYQIKTYQEEFPTITPSILNLNPKTNQSSKMCCRNKQRRRGLIATGIYLVAQKIEQRRQLRIIQSQTAAGSQSFGDPITTIQSTIPSENPPPYVEEKEDPLQRDSKIIKTKSEATHRSVYPVDKRERSNS
jgi:hypothetical protein